MPKSIVRFFCAAVFALCALAFIPNFATAADFQPIPPDEMKLKEVPGYPGVAAVVLYHEEIDDDNLHYQEIYSRIKILTEAGREKANVEIPYNRRGFNISDIKGRTVHADGSIVPFEGKPFDKAIVKDRDRKYNVKAFTLPDVQVGSIIEYRYTYRYEDNSLVAPDWILQTDLPQLKVHYVFKPYMEEWVNRHGLVSSGVKFTYHTPKNVAPVFGNEACPRTSMGQTCKKVVLDLTNVAPIIDEPYMPPEDSFKYNVRFYYDTNRKMEEFWKEEGKFWNKDVEHFIGNDDALRAELTNLVSPQDTPEQKVRKIYAHVLTYANLSFGSPKTFQEREAMGLTGKYGVDKVIKAKTGDDEDLTRLFVGLVRQAGIPAYVARITARDDSFFIPQVMSWDQLDTELAIVRLGDNDVFLDPGTRFCPYGMLYWKVSGTQGIRQSATGKGTEFVKVPEPSYKDAQMKRSGRFSLAADGKLEGTLAVTFFGQEALLRRIRAAKTDAEGRTKLIEDEVKGWLPNNAEVTLQNKPEWENGEQPLNAVLKVSAGVLTSAGRRRLLPMQVFDFSRPAVFQHSQRNYIVYIEFPYSIIDEIRVTLPAGATPESVPTGEEVKLSYAIYATQYAMQGRELVASRVLGMANNVFPVELYGELKTFYEKVKAGDDQQIVLTGGATSVQAK